MGQILVINGPNQIGQPGYQPQYYGTESLAEINKRLAEQARSAGHSIDFYESGSEPELAARVRAAAQDGTGVVIINPTHLTYRGFELRAAFEESGVPMIEVHLSNIFRRQAFRHHSLFSDLAQALITGAGARSYEYALDAAMRILDDPDANLHAY
ncbi:MAG: type II 3-dehydroquinate dehydratase [Gammaproteobacteria bacterium]|nr:type II 3-dehydroquinate dehydratase [Gammaproteobacteria bacterium]